MSKLLVVTNDMCPSGPVRRLDLFARSMPPGEVEICLIGSMSPWARSLSASGVSVHAIGSRGALDLRGLWRLRDRVRRAARIWTWGPGTAWPVVLGGRCPSRIVSPLSAEGRPSFATKWLVRRCDLFVVDSEAEATSLRRLGVAEHRLRVVRPGVEVIPPVPPASLPGLPDDAKVMLVIGPIARHKGVREAVWALDILAYLEERLHLVLVGEGPDMAGVHRFVETTHRENKTHFAGAVADLAPWLARADLVVAGGVGGGRMGILDAMAAERPVVATQSADRTDLLDHGRTGLFAKVKDIPDLCRQIMSILENETLARTLGSNARAEVRQRFGVAAFVEAMLRE